ncbi:glucosamine-6-phosphate deaminase [Thermostilla marina]
MEVIITPDYDAMSRVASRLVAETLNEKPDAVLGLATGETHKGLYAELARLHREEHLDFSRVTTFNLAEFVGLDRDHLKSHHYFMHEHFFKFVNILPQNIHIPSGTTANYRAFCEWYERRITECGGIDLQILGVGPDGHIGFNEPGSSLGSRTRIKTLSQKTLDALDEFFDTDEEKPTYAITMGVGTVLEARKIIFLASGEAKAEAVAATIEGPVTSMITASALQLHRDTVAILDEAAASRLKLRDYYRSVQEKLPGAPLH